MAEYTITKDVEIKDRKVLSAKEDIRRLIRSLKYLADREKVRTGEIDFKSEGLLFIQEVQAAIDKYVTSCSTTMDITYTDEEVDILVAEYDELTIKITALEQDGDINNIQDVREYKVYKERQVELQEVKTKLEAAGKVF